MSSNKTVETDTSVENFINSVDNEQKRKSDYEEQMARLGPHKTGKSCLYLKNLDVVDRNVLEEIVRDSVRVMRGRYECT
jgi:hypothetical protein